MTDEQQALKPFEREERYIVVKRKHLSGVQETALRAHMARLDVDTVECVVIESDWPEYERVWGMIEDRVAGRPSLAFRAAQPGEGIPAGMKPWNGGDSAPEDWDGGPILLRDGELMKPFGRGGLSWRHFGEDHPRDIIAYTPKPTPSIVGDLPLDKYGEPLFVHKYEVGEAFEPEGAPNTLPTREVVALGIQRAAEKLGNGSDYDLSAHNWIRNRRDQLADAILSLLPAEPVQEMREGWRDIESAPKDGTEFLAFWPSIFKGVVSAARWNDDRYATKPRPYWSSCASERFWGTRETRAHPPTHWMPMPAPPRALAAPQEQERQA